jgi:hypothetical protein
MTATPRVDITQSGRGGSIRYVEGAHTIDFGWEFAMPPAIALIFGPGARGWDAAFPWAAGRQAAVYDVVGSEVVRQQASSGSYAVELGSGCITIYRERARESQPRGPRVRHASAPTAPVPERAPIAPRDPVWTRFAASVVPSWASWPDDVTTYDLAALTELSPPDREAAAALLRARDASWREVEALALLDVPAAWAGVQEALVHHLSLDTRLAAAEALHRRDPTLDLGAVLTREIRQLHRPSDGLARALRMAERHDTPAVRQALLWASVNATTCAPSCARLLLELAGLDPATPELQATLGQLGLHVSAFTRDDGFAKLCRAVGMELDTSQG